jgi:hypothetical protein
VVLKGADRVWVERIFPIDNPASGRRPAAVRRRGPGAPGPRCVAGRTPRRVWIAIATVITPLIVPTVSTSTSGTLPMLIP